MVENVFQAIEQKLSSFSKGKQQIAAYILKNPNEAAFQTASQIGKTVKISESTVVRFAGDLGYKGFPEFQKALQQVVKAQLQTGEFVLSSYPEEEEGDPFCRSIETSRRELKHFMGDSNRAIIDSFVDVLEHCRELYLIASPLGELLLPYCKYTAEMVLDRVNLLFLRSKEALFQDLSRITQRDQVLALCIGEIPPALRFTAEQAKLLGAEVLWITDTPSQYIRTLSDPVLEIPPQEQGSLSDMSRFVALIHGLFSLLISKRETAFRDRNKFIEEIRNAYDKYEESHL